eukprot:Gb_04286 [translate_table: standard]
MANFDVFINHRGKDVKDTLASHIYDLLQFHGVRAFLDREELRTGEEFPDAITEAIQSSPPTNITKDILNKSRLARAVVQEVLEKIKSEPLIGPKFPVGLKEPVAQLREYIIRCRMEKKHVAFVGIIGFAGVGKTTLAKALFNNIRWDLNFNFERASFIEDIKEEVEKRGLQVVRLKLLQNLLHLSHRQAEQIIRKRLRNIDALIVLDNIEDDKQLEAVLSPEDLLPGSTVIVTSSDSSIFKRNNFLKYEMLGLDSSQSRELFCLHAFDSGVPCAPFKNLVDKVISVCKGIP